MSDSANPSAPTQSNNTASSRPSPLQFDPSLLQPVVRSKRTPVACTECRRRQVKCSGARPTCERCEKKGLNCEYMPIYMQKAAAAGATTSGSRRNPGSTITRSTGEIAQSRVPVYAPYPSQPRYVPSNSPGHSGWADPATSLNSLSFHEAYNTSIPVHEQVPSVKEGTAHRLTYQKSDTFYAPVGDASMASTLYEHPMIQPQFECDSHIAHGIPGSVSSLGLYYQSRTPTPTVINPSPPHYDGELYHSMSINNPQWTNAPIPKYEYAD